MKQKHKRTYIFLSIAVIVIGGGIFLLYRHLDAGRAAGTPNDSNSSPRGAQSADVQMFSGDGYSLGVPAGWRVEQNAKDELAAYPDPVAAATTSTESCKIEMSVFPYAPSMSAADWISGRIGADPSLAVTERSSADVAVNGGTAVEWNGTIDGTPTTLVYAFSEDHAYEIAPSVVNETGSGNAACDDALETFLSRLTIK